MNIEVKKLINPILKHFGYQIIKKSKKKKKGWKQQGRGTKVTVGSAFKATTAPSRPERQAPHDISKRNDEKDPVWKKVGDDHWLAHYEDGTITEIKGPITAGEVQLIIPENLIMPENLINGPHKEK